MSRRNLFLIVVVACWAVVGIVLGSGAFSRTRAPIPPSGPASRCLPAQTDGSGAIGGVDVSPQPGASAASPSTQISFLGAPVTRIRIVSVRGSRSGLHPGRLIGYSQGDGGSFLPNRRFAPNETVTTRALVGATPAQRPVAFSFHIATPLDTRGLKGFTAAPAAASDYRSFHSNVGFSTPIMTVNVRDHDPGAGYFFVTPQPGPGHGPAIYDRFGHLVWSDALPKGTVAANLGLQRYRGRQVLSWWQGKILQPGFGQGEDVLADHTYRTVAVVRAGNGYRADLHDFRLARTDVAYLTAYNLIRCDLSPAGGVRNGVLIDNLVQAVDINTGLVRFEWHSTDHVTVQESHVTPPSTPQPFDYFHLNSIQIEANGNLLISARSTWAVYYLRAGSGAVIWRLGGTRSSFKVSSQAQPAWQHDAKLHPNGIITLFDDGSSPRVHDQSRGLVLALDSRRHRVRLVHSYIHASPLVADSQGNMQRLPGGRWLIGWGAVPYVSEFSASGKLLFDAHMPAGTTFYRAFRYPWQGHPSQPPAVGATQVGPDSTAVYASWNGDTRTRSWRVLAGSSPSNLQPVDVMPRSDFESSVLVPEAYAYVAVQALSASGRVLTTSSPTSVSLPTPAS